MEESETKEKLFVFFGFVAIIKDLVVQYSIGSE